MFGGQQTHLGGYRNIYLTRIIGDFYTHMSPIEPQEPRLDRFAYLAC